MLLLQKFEDYMLPCLNKKIFGIDCPGCGMQRSIAFLLEGNFKAAFHIYPAIYSIILLVGFLLINLFVKFKFQSTIKMGLVIANVLIILISYFIKLNHITHHH